MIGSICVAQSSAPARTDVYHVLFAKAALGKGAELGESLKTADPNVPMSAHRIVLRHQEGEDWDYAVIEHLGTKATVEAAGTPSSPAVRDLYAWHTDTFVNGPSWPEFSKALERDPERVRADVRDGYVSLEAAAREYGVVLSELTTLAHRRETGLAP